MRGGGRCISKRTRTRGGVDRRRDEPAATYDGVHGGHDLRGVADDAGGSREEEPRGQAHPPPLPVVRTPRAELPLHPAHPRREVPRRPTRASRRVALVASTTTLRRSAAAAQVTTRGAADPRAAAGGQATRRGHRRRRGPRLLAPSWGQLVTQLARTRAMSSG